MTLSKSDIMNLKNAMKAFAVMFVDSSVTLVETRAVIEVKAHVGLRSTGVVLGSSRASALTGGSDQDRYVGVIDWDSWNSASPGRPPKKGDMINYGDQGMKYVIERVVPAQPSEIGILYKAELRG